LVVVVVVRWRRRLVMIVVVIVVMVLLRAGLLDRLNDSGAAPAENQHGGAGQKNGG
jgi:hypothetical protein